GWTRDRIQSSLVIGEFVPRTYQTNPSALRRPVIQFARYLGRTRTRIACNGVRRLSAMVSRASAPSFGQPYDRKGWLASLCYGVCPAVLAVHRFCRVVSIT